MQRVFAAARAVLVEFHPVRIVAAILFRDVIAFLAIVARQRDHRADVFLFRSHELLELSITQ
jgi:hypothetical protein